MAVTSFDFLKVTNGNYKPASGTNMLLGCTGGISGETDVKTVTKMCEGVPVKEQQVPQFMTLTFRGHINVDVYRSIFGLANTGLKAGVYSYGSSSLGSSGTLTFKLVDMDGVKEKLIAFPNVKLNSGFVFSYENGAEEVAEVELEFKAMVDAQGNIYYEGFVDDIADATIKSGWAAAFNYDLVKSLT